jgi:hypothetical protein
MPGAVRHRPVAYWPRADDGAIAVASRSPVLDSLRLYVSAYRDGKHVLVDTEVVLSPRR